MPEYDYDLFVIGAGSGGVRAARMAARHGARVAIAEDRALGGTCVNVGCVPKKLLVHSSEYGRHFADAAGFGWTPPAPQFDWSRLIANKNREIERLNNIYARLLDDASADRISGRAVLQSPHEVCINGEMVYSARHILIAVGGWPSVPPVPGAEFAISSNEVFYLDKLPRQIAIVGGGYIAVEFAGIFNGLGVETHLIHRRDHILKEFDQELADHLVEEMTEQGIHLHFNANVSRLDKSADGKLKVTLDSGDVLAVEQAMFATGRAPKTEGLGLENTGVELDRRGCVIVNDRFQTREPSIFALGDVIGRVELTPVAIREAMVLTDNLFAGQERAMDYGDIPSAVFSSPPLASVGLGEQQAREKYGDIRVFRTRFKPLKASLSGASGRILMKLVVDADSDRVVGCHMIGEGAAEIIQGLAVAVKAKATKADFDSTVGIHPTIAEEFVTMSS